jgi:hypothetical protein
MSHAAVVAWAAVVIGLVAGVGLLCVRVDAEALRRSVHRAPGISLMRFRAVRWIGGLLCLGVSLVVAASRLWLA